MRIYLLLVCLVLGVWGEEKELIMLEIEAVGPEEGGKTVNKRSPQTGSPYGAQQYVLRNPGQPEPPPQVPGEYLSLLQQLQSQQGVQSQQVHPNDIQQLLVSRTPYQFTASQSSQPLRPRLTPQAQQQRRLQEELAQKNIREQEARDAQRQQVRQYYQQQGFPAGTYQLQPQIPQQQVQAQPQLPTPQPIQYYQASTPQPTQQYYQQEPEQVSYTQVQFGDTRQPSPSKQQQFVYPGQQAQQLVYRVQRPTAEVPKAAAPQQYLIETTKQEEQQPVVAIPRPVVYYRPQGDYREVQTSLLAGQQEAQYAKQQQEASLGHPSRSSIFISRNTSPDAKRVRIPTPQGQRPLTQSELKALVDAGFQVAPQQAEAPEYITQYASAPQRAYYRSLTQGKRQSKRVPKPVPLSKEEREALAQQGIRNLYTVETAESRNTPVTYVLALGKTQNS